MAARAMWKGVVRMGDVATPVKVYAAVEDRSVRFRLLERRTQTPVSQKLVDPVAGKVVAYEDTRRGFVTDDDELVLLEPDELEALEPEASRDIDVVQFVPPEAIDHRWYVRPYYLGPDGDLPRYTALAAALAAVAREGVAHWTMRNKAYVGALRLHRSYPVLVTLRTVDEVVPVEQVERPVWKPLDDRQLKMARQLLEMLEAPFEPDAYRDAYRERVEELIEAKRDGERPKLPVQLFPANRTARASLRMVSGNGQPLERRYFASDDDAEPLDSDAIVRGFPIGDDRFVVLEDEELEALDPDKSHEIDLSRFVAEDEVDPMLFERGYFLAPDRGALKAYRLLAKTMEEAGRIGIATFVMRDTEYLVAIIAEDGILRAQTLRFHDELRSPDDVGLPELGDADAGLREEADRAMKRLVADDLDRTQLRDRATKRLLDLVARKREAGEDVVELASDSGESPADEVDLMQVLKQSLAQAGEEDEEGTGGARGTKATPAADLEGHTKGELYERARALDVEGRSGMTKQELVEAIRAAS